MDYFTVYSTKDPAEVSVLQNLYEEEKINFRIVEQERLSGETENPVIRFQVSEENKTKAKDLLDQTGFLRAGTPAAPAPKRMPGKKWILVFLALIIVVIVAFIIVWFMNTQ